MKKTLIASVLALGVVFSAQAKDIVDTAVAAGSFKTLATALTAAGLVDTLKVGKSYLGCALGNKACRDGYRVRYWSVPKLLRELSTASADGSLARLLKQIARVDLLILDDWGLERLKDTHAQLLLEIVEDRQDSGSVLITSQFAVASWHELIANPTVADALLDRLVHNAHRIELKGESMRKMKTGRTPAKA